MGVKTRKTGVDCRLVTVGSWHYLANEIEMFCDTTRCNMEAVCDNEYLSDDLWSLESEEFLITFHHVPDHSSRFTKTII